MENYENQELKFLNIYKRESEIKQVEKEMRDYLNKLKGEYPFVLGFLLHGSRFDKKRTPRENSDVDTVLILEDGNLTASHLEEGRALVEKLVSYIRAHKTDSGFEVEPNDFYTVSEFFTEIDSQETPKTLSGKSIWGSNPEAFRYIGDSIDQKSETEINDFLKKELSSNKN